MNATQPFECPKCKKETCVIDSRGRKTYIFRRRKCLSCGHRITTRETPWPMPMEAIQKALNKAMGPGRKVSQAAL